MLRRHGHHGVIKRVSIEDTPRLNQRRNRSRLVTDRWRGAEAPVRTVAVRGLSDSNRGLGNASRSKGPLRSRVEHPARVRNSKQVLGLVIAPLAVALPSTRRARASEARSMVDGMVG